MSVKKVWYKIGNAEPDRVTVSSDADVLDLKEAVKKRWGDRLECAVAELKVFEGRTAMDPGDEVPSNTTCKQPLTVKTAPLKQHPPAKQPNRRAQTTATTRARRATNSSSSTNKSISTNLVAEATQLEQDNGEAAAASFQPPPSPLARATQKTNRPLPGPTKRSAKKSERTRSFRVTDSALHPVNGLLRGRLDGVCHHWPVDHGNSGVPHKCQLHRWACKIVLKSQVKRCSQCQVFLCPTCFILFHTEANLVEKKDEIGQQYLQELEQKRQAWNKNDKHEHD